MSKRRIHTDQAPDAIGTYSQATQHGNLVFLSGQIPLDPGTMELIEGDIDAQVRRVFDNLAAVCEAAGGGLDDIVKLTVFLTDMVHFPRVNAIMSEYFAQPYPARAAIGVAALPKGAQVEMDAILGL
jgi:reactive intermediate/imine deaminase